MGALGIVAVIAYVVLWFFQAAAFFDGVAAALDWGRFAQVVLLIICTIFGTPGAIVMTGFAFYGAFEVWNWEWWQAALLAAPFLIYSLAVLVFAGSFSVIGWAFSRGRAE